VFPRQVGYWDSTKNHPTVAVANLIADTSGLGLGVGLMARDVTKKVFA